MSFFPSSVFRENEEIGNRAVRWLSIVAFLDTGKNHPKIENATPYGACRVHLAFYNMWAIVYYISAFISRTRFNTGYDYGRCPSRYDKALCDRNSHWSGNSCVLMHCQIEKSYWQGWKFRILLGQGPAVESTWRNPFCCLFAVLPLDGMEWIQLLTLIQLCFIGYSLPMRVSFDPLLGPTGSLWMLASMAGRSGTHPHTHTRTHAHTHPHTRLHTHNAAHICRI